MSLYTYNEVQLLKKIQWKISIGFQSMHLHEVQRIETKAGTKQQYQYDARGNITAVIDGNQNKTRYHLDNWGKITQIEKADGSYETYAYDHAGNRTKRIASGIEETYSYDQRNRLIGHTK